MAIAGGDTVDVTSPLGFDQDFEETSININDDPQAPHNPDVDPADPNDAEGENTGSTEQRAGKSDAERLKAANAAKRKLGRERDALARRLTARDEQVESRFGQYDGVINQLRERLMAYETGGVQQAKDAAEHAYQLANAAYREAMTLGDIDRIIAATENRDNARDRLRAAQTFQPRAIEVPEPRRPRAPQQPSGDVASHAQAFMQRNPWVRVAQTPQGPVALNAETAAVMELERVLLSSGSDLNSADHWDELEEMARDRLPERFTAQQRQQNGGAQTGQRRQAMSPVAGGSRAPAQGGGAVKLPAEYEKLQRAMGRDMNDPKVRERAERYYAQTQAARRNG